MPPNDDLHTQVQQNTKRLDAHEDRFRTVDERLNIQSQRSDRYLLILEGDEKAGIKGVVAMIRDMGKAVDSLMEWRKEWEITFRLIRIAIPLTLFLLTLMAAGEWRTQILELIKLLEKIP